MKKEHQSSYRSIMKATSIFGGVQVFNIIIQVVRSKIIAVFLGSAGMGLMGLFNATIGILGNLTNFGLGISAVKDIATADNCKDEDRISDVITAFRRIVWITGILGLILTVVLSPWLSQLTFGNKRYTIAFIFLSVTLLFNQLSSGQKVLLQGVRKHKYLAKSDVIGSLLGLIATLPFYFIYGIDGIVPGIIVTSLFLVMTSWYFSNKVKVKKRAQTTSQTIAEGKGMLRMGFMISLSGLMLVGSSYIVRIYISRVGGIEQVGLYSAGFTIINTYVGMVFAAMATDYYPRLTTVANDTDLCRKTINQQAEIAILILAPILIVFLIFIKWIVILLYSYKFGEVNEMIYWAAMGMFFKATSWSISFVFLAKGASKIFFWNELIANVYLLAFNLLGYHFFGLTGLGISFAVSYIIYLLQVYYISKIKFEFSFDRDFLTIFCIHFGLCIAGFITIKYVMQPYNYILGIILIAISVWYSIIELEKRIGILSILKTFQAKIKNN
jgi:O-antigen/teichoic acid export membrane protein